MPELPEVEAARRAIHDHCVGKKIRSSIVADDSKVIDGISPSEFQSSLIGKTIIAAHRKGKNMWIELDSPPFPSFQFGMAGAVYIKGVAVTKYKRSAVSDTDEWPSKYSKLLIELDDGLEFSFTDKRRFAKVRLLENPSSKPPISELGPDALLEPMTLDEFVRSLGKKKIAIKALLLDQSFVAGIGNWIADEVLYQARIHPLQVAGTLSKENCESLLKCIKEVVNYAVEVDADSNKFPTEWMFHFRWGKKPGKVNGKEIEFITAGGRTTAYVPELQKLTGAQAKKALSTEPKEQSLNEDDEEEDVEDRKTKSKTTQKKPRAEAKKPNPKRKSNSSDSDDNRYEDGEGEEKKVKKATKGKGPIMKVETSKKPKTTQAKQPKKKT